jgi:RNA polymerase sigma-70 factor (ECF subfamily)
LGNIIPFRSKPTDQDRFDQLVRPHFDALYVSAVRLTRSEQDAEDLLQEVLMKSLAWLDELERVEFRKAWLIKVMYNTFIDQTRSDQRSPLSQVDEAKHDPDQEPAHDDSLEHLFDRQQRVDRVLRAMRYMNYEDCALIGMHDVEGLTIKELKQVTGMPEGTIKARLHRARKKLGRLLANDAVAAPRLRVVGGKDEL